jgi:radical SAM protein with 4Fe4S-binding SPASM domain
MGSDMTEFEVPKLPPRVIMDLRTDCNLKCPMCVVHGDTDNKELMGFLRSDMGLENAAMILDELKPVRPMVMPSLWSEPLLSREFRAHARAIKERGFTLAMNTNGLLLRKDLAEFFVEIGVDAVSVSIDSTTKETLKKVRGIDRLDKLHKAVDVMLEARGDKELPRVGVSFTVQEENIHEREAFVDNWAHKVDFVRVGELFVDGKFPNVEVVGPRKPCPALYSTLSVHATGSVSICCLDGFAETNMGNVFEEGVEAVWNGEKFNEVRHYHETGQWEKAPKMCKNCERWASYGFEEELVDGLLIRRSPEYTYYNRVDKLENWGGGLLGTHKDPKESLAELQTR